MKKLNGEEERKLVAVNLKRIKSQLQGLELKL